MTLKRIVVIHAVLAASICTWLSAQSAKLSADAHLAAWDTHKAMAASSPYKNLSWSYLGPTNVAGRVSDMAVADKDGQRRIYVATCCGGV